MNKNYTLKKWPADATGVSVTAHGISICAELYGRESNGILLYGRENAEPVRIDFTEEMRSGSVYRCMLSGVPVQDHTYLFHEDGMPVTDPLAKRLVGHRLFGEEHAKAGEEDALKACAFVSGQFDWRGDKRPGTAYEDSVYYGMHVRGFTKDPSSRIKEAGTFAGVQKKIPYLKKLGVTGIVLQPVYEFEECMRQREARTVSDALQEPAGKTPLRLNYWGYLPGFYLAPKNAYAYSDDAVTELKTLVRQLHKNDLEVILQFYFEPDMPAVRMRDILVYWVKHYHIDGFELLGASLPLKEIALEPELSDAKLWSEWFPYDEIDQAKKKRVPVQSPETGRKPAGKKALIKEKRYLASASKEYQNTLRRFLKGDGGLLSAFLQCQRDNPEGYGKINFLASYDGFRLADVVSYEKKHNEANGEDNRDGENENFSWNCGMEGETKKKSILALRMKLMKNALIMLFTAQGTPFLFMGDEWGKSSGGNNNPYCQDNEITWQKWNLKKAQKELLDFTEQLIALRKAHGVMHQKGQLKFMDYLSCGCPDLSYHGQEAWRTSMDYQTRHIGVMLCGKYCVVDGKEDDCLYMAYNMHWEPHDFALPKLFKDRRWKLLLDTGEERDTEQKGNTQADAVSGEISGMPGSALSVNPVGASAPELLANPEGRTDGGTETAEDAGEKIPVSDITSQSVTLSGRSVRIYISEEVPKAAKKRRYKKRT